MAWRSGWCTAANALWATVSAGDGLDLDRAGLAWLRALESSSVAEVGLSRVLVAVAFVVGLVVGCVLGMVLMGLLQASRDEFDQSGH